MKSLKLLIVALLIVLNAKAQETIPYNGPDYIFAGSKQNYSSVTLTPGQLVSWKIIQSGTIDGLNTSTLVFYDKDASNNNLNLVATITQGTQSFSVNKTIPVISKKGNISEGNDQNADPGKSAYQISNLLRGQRIKITCGSGSTLTLLSSQLRIVPTGPISNQLDVRVPTRGIYYVLVNNTGTSSTPVSIQGVIQYTPYVAGGIDYFSSATVGDGVPAVVGNLESEFYHEKNKFTSGESIITVGDKIISCVYDYSLKQTLISAYRISDLGKIWTSATAADEYIRTIVSNSDGTKIAGIGSSGVAGAADKVVVISFNVNSPRTVQKCFFGLSDGLDFGYGISFLPNNDLVATGFTSGKIEPNAQKNGGLDAFAAYIKAGKTTVESYYQFGGTYSDRVFASRTLKNGNVLLYGDAEGYGTPSYKGLFDCFLKELNVSTGEFVSVRDFVWGSSENDLAFDMVIDTTQENDLIYVTGQTTGKLSTSDNANPEKTQVFTSLITLESNAYEINWTQQLGPPEGQSAESIALRPNGAGVGTIFYTFGDFAGISNNSLGTEASDDMVIALFDQQGNIESNKLFQFNQTQERIFARAISFNEVGNMFVLRDHVYETNTASSNLPYITTSLYGVKYNNGNYRASSEETAVNSTDSPTTNDRNFAYPNPSSLFIYLKCDKGYQIYTATGLLVKESFQSVENIYIGNLDSGVYVIKHDGYTDRFIKN